MTDLDHRYLLRVWREDQGDSGLRATLRDVNDGKVRSFGGLDGLVEFLETASGETKLADAHDAVAPEERGDDDA